MCEKPWPAAFGSSPAAGAGAAVAPGNSASVWSFDDFAGFWIGAGSCAEAASDLVGGSMDAASASILISAFLISTGAGAGAGVGAGVGVKAACAFTIFTAAVGRCIAKGVRSSVAAGPFAPSFAPFAPFAPFDSMARRSWLAWSSLRFELWLLPLRPNCFSAASSTSWLLTPSSLASWLMRSMKGCPGKGEAVKRKRPEWSRGKTIEKSGRSVAKTLVHSVENSEGGVLGHAIYGE